MINKNKCLSNFPIEKNFHQNSQLQGWDPGLYLFFSRSLNRTHKHSGLLEHNITLCVPPSNNNKKSLSRVIDLQQPRSEYVNGSHVHEMYQE